MIRWKTGVKTFPFGCNTSEALTDRPKDLWGSVTTAVIPSRRLDLLHSTKVKSPSLPASSHHTSARRRSEGPGKWEAAVLARGAGLRGTRRRGAPAWMPASVRPPCTGQREEPGPDRPQPRGLLPAPASSCPAGPPRLGGGGGRGPGGSGADAANLGLL